MNSFLSIFYVPKYARCIYVSPGYMDFASHVACLLGAGLMVGAAIKYMRLLRGKENAQGWKLAIPFIFGALVFSYPALKPARMVGGAWADADWGYYPSMLVTLNVLAMLIGLVMIKRLVPRVVIALTALLYMVASYPHIQAAASVAELVFNKILAETGNVDAQWYVGDFYTVEARNRGCEFFQPVEALKWYRMAYDSGDSRAAIRIGDIYTKYDPSAFVIKCPPALVQPPEAAWHKIQSNDEAMKWYRRAADKGNAIAMARVGYLYMDPVNKPDVDKAAKWFARAVEKGDRSAIKQYMQMMDTYGNALSACVLAKIYEDSATDTRLAFNDTDVALWLSICPEQQIRDDQLLESLKSKLTAQQADKLDASVASWQNKNPNQHEYFLRAWNPSIKKPLEAQ